MSPSGLALSSSQAFIAGDQGVAADEVELHGQDAEEQVAVGGRGHGRYAPNLGQAVGPSLPAGVPAE